MMTHRLLLAASATLALLVGRSQAFFAAAPGLSTLGAARGAARGTTHALEGPSSGVQARAALVGPRATWQVQRSNALRSRTIGGIALRMSVADTAVDQKGLVTVYHKTTCPHCQKASKWGGGGVPGILLRWHSDTVPWYSSISTCGVCLAWCLVCDGS